tara:strand:+ start:1815 stop:1988 length:174 start_codon:yes stop_codon:yes gene_type:complete
MEIIQNLAVTFMVFGIGFFFGSLWMYFVMDKTLKYIQKELDSKTHSLNEFRNKEPFL